MLAISLLGQVQFALDGRPLTEFETDKARGLLIYLAMNAGRPHRRAGLSALFWAEQDDKGASQNLRKTLHRLRQTLERDQAATTPFLLVTPQSVQFNTASRCTLDVVAFEALIAETRQHRHRRLASCRVCVERLTCAIQLYRGDFLAGFSIKGSPEFDGWVALQRERFRIQALDALNVLAAYHERRGEYGPMRDYARRQLELEPWQEIAHRQLMRALAHDGKRAAVLAQYEACRRVLLEELGVEPEPETTALYEQIKASARGSRGAGGLGSGSSAHSLTRFPAPLRNFPARLTSFVGRDTELAQIGELLSDPDCRLVTLVGPGGSGKTRLAVEAAKAEASGFEDGACFVPLASIASADLIAGEVARALGLPLLASQDVKAQVLAFLRDREMLLVFDNFEHLMPAASLISAKLQACPGLSILVTSREPLHLYGEREYPVPPLPTPGLAQGHTNGHAHTAPQGATGVRASTLSRFPSVELFVQRSQVSQPDFHLNDDNAAAVGAICDRLDGLPLAIELAAARSKVFTPHEMLVQLKHRFAFLTAGARDLPARQQTLWNTIDWSYLLLEGREQILFRRLATFAGGFAPASVEAVCNADGALGGDMLHLLATLVDKSLIHMIPNAQGVRGRDAPSDAAGGLSYGVLETLREYASAKLNEAGVAEAVRMRDAHLRVYGAFAEENERKMLRGEMSQSIIRFEREHDNLRAALAWAYERGHVDMGLRLVGALSRFWRSCGFLDEGGEWSARVLAADAAVGEKASPAARAKALLGAAEIARIAGRNDEAGSLAERSLVLYRELGDEAGAGYALAVLGAMAHYAKMRARATDLLAEAETLFRTAGDERGLGYALLWLGDVRLRMGDVDWAARCFGEALPIFRGLGDRIYLSWALGGLADIARLRGDYADAEATLKEALRLHIEVNNKAGMPFPVEALAIVAVAQGRYERAALIWGIIEALRQIVNLPLPASYQADYDPHIAEARAHLGQAAFDEAKAEGRALAFDEAIALMLDDKLPSDASGL